MELQRTKRGGEYPEEYLQRTLGDGVQSKFQSHRAEIVRAANKSPVYMMSTNDVEERERYRFQWRKEDRQRIVSDRLELGVAVVTGVLMGLFPGGVVMGGVTGFVIWFATGMVRNWWSP